MRLAGCRWVWYADGQGSLGRRGGIMSTVDCLFLAGFVVVLTAMLASSKVVRAIAWDCLRHPFTPARIEVDGREVRVRRPAPKQPEGADQPVREQTPSGVR